MSRFCHYICNQIAQSGIVLLKMIGARAKAVETLGIVSLALKSCRGLDGSCKKKEISHRSENKEAALISDRVWAEGGWFNMYQFLLFACPHESLIVSA